MYTFILDDRLWSLYIKEPGRIDWLINLIDWLDCRSINPSIHQSINQLIHQSINQRCSPLEITYLCDLQMALNANGPTRTVSATNSAAVAAASLFTRGPAHAAVAHLSTTRVSSGTSASRGWTAVTSTAAVLRFGPCAATPRTVVMAATSAATRLESRTRGVCTVRQKGLKRKHRDNYQCS